MLCKECILGMKPDDPRIKTGRYHLCGCDYCDKPTYYRELEAAQPIALPQTPPEHRLIKKLLEIQGMANNTRMKLQEHLTSKKKSKFTIKE